MELYNLFYYALYFLLACISFLILLLWCVVIYAMVYRHIFLRIKSDSELKHSGSILERISVMFEGLLWSLMTFFFAAVARSLGVLSLVGCIIIWISYKLISNTGVTMIDILVVTGVILITSLRYIKNKST